MAKHKTKQTNDNVIEQLMRTVRCSVCGVLFEPTSAPMEVLRRVTYINSSGSDPKPDAMLGSCFWSVTHSSYIKTLEPICCNSADLADVAVATVWELRSGAKQKHQRWAEDWRGARGDLPVVAHRFPSTVDSHRCAGGER